MQMSFPDGAAFVSMRGSWNRKPFSGYEVVRVRFREGVPASIEPFVTGLLKAEGEHRRLTSNPVASDGSLLFTDDLNGVIYRVSTGFRKRTVDGHVRLARLVPRSPEKSVDAT